MSTLYELTGELLQLQAMLEDGLEDEAVLADTLEAVDGEYEYKMEAYCKLIRNLEAERDAHKAEAKRHSDRATSLDNSVDRLKKAMFDSMRAVGKDKVKSNLFTVAIQKNGGKIPVIYDKTNKGITASLPDELVNYVETPNLDAIREQLEAGKVINGFTLGERGESLRIK